MVRIWGSTFLSILLLGGSLSTLAQQPAVQAQTITFKASVPFPFVLGNQTLPPGTYQIQRLLGRPADADEVGMIVVRSTDPYVYKAVVTNLVRQSVDSDGNSHLVFARHSGQRYLSEVRIGGERGHQISCVPSGPELTNVDVSQEEVVLADLR